MNPQIQSRFFKTWLTVSSSPFLYGFNNSFRRRIFAYLRLEDEVPTSRMLC
uniref:Uncharacterized protein n=1 Tax=Klebsiella pneumoniae TaxID=573 RepID=A0A455TML8_KLEPN|nr:hypothetical protein [Klebsiella pneumoniae]